MSKKTRYLLITFGFVFFLILAPIIVLYVRGITFDLKTRKFVQTGILATRTDPKSVKVFINGKKALNSNGDIKFLLPGEYNITIEKDGYFDWSKRLPVQAGKVTWVNPAPNKLYLFLKNPAVSTVSSGVADFYADNSSLIYLSDNNIVTSSPTDPTHSENLSLPKYANHILASPNGQTFILTNTQATDTAPTFLVFDKNSGQLTDLAGLFKAPAVFKFSGNNQLYALSDRQLYRIDWQQKTKTLVKSQILAFAFRENDLYYLQGTPSTVAQGSLEQDRGTTGTTAALMMATPAEATGTAILNGAPSFGQGDIFVDFERQILLLLDGQLYQVGSTLQNLSGNVKAWNFDYGQSTLVFTHDGELSFYDPFRHGVDFITRSSYNITNPVLNLAYDDSFFIRDNKLEVLELDTRDHQNDYVLYSGTNLQKFALANNSTSAFVLDNGELKVLKIR